MSALHLLGHLLSAVVLIDSALATGNPLNGAAPRPFYIFAHNPNTLAEVEKALTDGANALEPDITLSDDDCGTGNPLDNLVDWDSSTPYRDGECSDTNLTEWLDGVHDLAVRPGAQLALVVFDIKSSAATLENGPLILNAIRTRLNRDGLNLNVIMSVASRDDGSVFDQLVGPHSVVQIGPREGVQIDGEDDAGAIVNYFLNDKGYNGNIGFGDGTSGPGPHLFTAIDGAVFSRAAVGYPKAVTYVYTINLADSMKAFIDAGPDGIITDHISQLVDVVRQRSDVVLATREHNPFQTLTEAYALKVTTPDVDQAGTDANITFTLTGQGGTSTITVDTSHTGRMEAGTTSYVTIPSRDLGPLQSIRVSNDNAGNAPDWFLGEISVYSAHWLQPNWCYHYTATLNDWVNGDSSRTLFFRTDEYVWGEFPPPLSAGTVTFPWALVEDGYCAVAPGGTVHVAAGEYPESLTLTKPCTLTLWPDHGAGPAVIGQP